MVPLMIPQVLAAEEVRRLHAAMLSILSRTGCRIEHAKMRERFCAYGGVVDSDGVTVHFPEAVVEKFIAESQKVDYTSVRPSVGMCVGVYQGLYLDPERNEPVPFTEETLAGYIRLARYLSADSSWKCAKSPRKPDSSRFRIFSADTFTCSAPCGFLFMRWNRRFFSTTAACGWGWAAC